MGYDLTGTIHLKAGAKKAFDIDRNYAFFHLIDSYAAQSGHLEHKELSHLLADLEEGSAKAGIAFMQDRTLKTFNWLLNHSDEVERITYSVQE